MNIVFGSVEQMLSSAGLSGILGAAITAVERAPLQVSHFSGNELGRVSGLCDGRPVTYVLKRFRPDRDWVMRLTHDSTVREVTLYRQNIYSRLPAHISIPILAVARDGNSWAMLMDDVGEWLVDNNRLPKSLKTSEVSTETFIYHLAAFHAHFLNDTILSDSTLGLSSLQDFVTILSPQTALREIAEGRSHPILQKAAEGWSVFEQLASPKVLSVVRELQQNPAPLLSALAHMPQTLLHGDFKFANLGLRQTADGPQSIWLDWQDATIGPPLLDLAYWLAVNPTLFPGDKKNWAINTYRTALAESGVTFADDVWERDLALCLVAGGALRLLWQMALRRQKGELSDGDWEWWHQHITTAQI
jgi:hypothetical protein